MQTVPTTLESLVRGVVLADVDAGFWLPERANDAGAQVDSLFYFIYYVCVFFFVLIVALMIFFIIRYRRPLGTPAEGKVTHNTTLELLWSGGPLVLLLVMFYWGFQGFLDLTTPMEGAHEITVQAQMWQFNFTYPNGFTDSVLHVPNDRPTKLVMTSQDVIHGFYVPAFRVQKNINPSRKSYVWFQPTRSGTYDLFCTQYCGKDHSNMVTKVVVQSPAEYQAYLANLAKPDLSIPAHERGKILWTKKGCYQCHSIDGAANTGPTWKNMFGETQTMEGGAQVHIDENYVRESILKPNAQIVKGYAGRNMPSYVGQLTEWQIDDLIAFMKSISEPYQKEQAAHAGQGTSAPASQPAAH